MSSEGEQSFLSEEDKLKVVASIPSSLFGDYNDKHPSFTGQKYEFDSKSVALGWVKDKLNDSQQRKYSFTRPTYAPNIDEIKSHTIIHPNQRIYNQGDIGSCTANALIGAYDNVCLRSGKGLPDLSRLFLYFEERIREGDANVDNGAMILTGVDTFKDLGCAEERIWPYSKIFHVRPIDDAYRNASHHKIIDAVRVPQTLRDIKQALLDGYPIVFGVMVFPSFMSAETARTGVISLPKPGERRIGGHAIYMFGFDNGALGGSFLIQNSWGPGWGIHGGKAIIPWNYVLNQSLASDFWAIKTIQES